MGRATIGHGEAAPDARNQEIRPKIGPENPGFGVAR